MIKPAKSKWPSVQLIIHCHTCNQQFRITIHYGESAIWGGQVGSTFAEWASHDEHDVEVRYDFYHGYKMSATGQ